MPDEIGTSGKALLTHYMNKINKESNKYHIKRMLRQKNESIQNKIFLTIIQIKKSL